MPPFLKAVSEGVYLSVKVQPRASKNAIGEVQGKELKVRITAPPVDSAANHALVDFLAETLGCPRGAIRIVRGQTSRHKQILITGMPATEVAGRLTT